QMPKGGQILVVAFAITAGLPRAALGDALEERFDTMWESLWMQTGAPTVVVRWAGEIRVRFTGSEAAGHRDFAFRALREATEAAGRALSGVPVGENGGEAA